MGCPIVNTPVTKHLRLPQTSSLLRQWWNSALSCDSRELPPYPRHYPGPWLGPLSSATVFLPVGSPFTVEPVGISIQRSSVRLPVPVPGWSHTQETEFGSKDRRG